MKLIYTKMTISSPKEFYTKTPIQPQHSPTINNLRFQIHHQRFHDPSLSNDIKTNLKNSSVPNSDTPLITNAIYKTSN